MLAALALYGLILGAPAQAAPAASVSPAPAAAQPDASEVDPGEPDFAVIILPTTLRLPKGKVAFQVTHRFARPLGRGDFGDLAADFFGFDGGAQVGLGLRYGLAERTQLGLYRTSDRTISVFAQQELLREDGAPVGLAAVASVEGRDNLQEEYSPRLGVVVSRRLGDRGAVYAAPAWVGNTRLDDDVADDGDDSTFVVGVGARFRLTEAMYVVGEVNPRVAGFKGGSGTHSSFGFEHRVGGHSFQINVSNDIGTTPAHVARGRQTEDDWFIGFNISRKFY